MLKYGLAVVTGLLIGLSAGYGISVFEDLPGMPSTLPGSTLGVSEQETSLVFYGFQPFWTLDTAYPAYAEYLSTLNFFSLQLNADGSIKTKNGPYESEPGFAQLQTDRVQSMLSDAASEGVRLALTVQMVDEDAIIALLAEPEQSANSMMDEVVPIMQQNGFTELNVDIESFIYAPPERQQAFARFLQTVDERMTEENLGIVSVDVVPISVFAPRLTDLRLIEPYVDLIILMTYDYHTTGSPVSGPVAPVGGGGSTREFDITVTLEEAIRLVPREKLLLGIPLYGYEWDTLAPSYYAPAIPGTGKIRTHAEVVQELASCSDCAVDRDQETLQPFVAIPQETADGDSFYRQIYYEDEESIAYKLRLAQAYDIHGLAFWALGYEGPSINRLLRQYQPSQTQFLDL